MACARHSANSESTPRVHAITRLECLQVLHLREAQRKQWCHPTRVLPATPGRGRNAAGQAAEAAEGAGAGAERGGAGAIGVDGGAGAGGVAMELEGLMPYWMDVAASGGGQRVVRNDITLDAMVVLTGPNTAGKGVA